MATDSANKAHISYYTKNYLPTPAIKYATNRSNELQIITIGEVSDTTGFDEGICSIALDSNDKTHIVYFYCGKLEQLDSMCSAGDLKFDGIDFKYATNKSGIWEILTIDSVWDAGQFSFIAVDSDDYVHITYYFMGDSHGALKYATNRPPK